MQQPYHDDTAAGAEDGSAGLWAHVGLPVPLQQPISQQTQTPSGDTNDGASQAAVDGPPLVLDADPEGTGLPMPQASPVPTLGAYSSPPRPTQQQTTGDHVPTDITNQDLYWYEDTSGVHNALLRACAVVLNSTNGSHVGPDTTGSCAAGDDVRDFATGLRNDVTAALAEQAQLAQWYPRLAAGQRWSHPLEVGLGAWQDTVVDLATRPGSCACPQSLDRLWLTAAKALLQYELRISARQLSVGSNFPSRQQAGREGVFLRMRLEQAQHLLAAQQPSDAGCR